MGESSIKLKLCASCLHTNMVVHGPRDKSNFLACHIPRNPPYILVSHCLYTHLYPFPPHTSSPSPHLMNYLFFLLTLTKLCRNFQQSADPISSYLLISFPKIVYELLQIIFMSPEHNLTCQLFLQIKFYWKNAIPYHLHIISYHKVRVQWLQSRLYGP